MYPSNAPSSRRPSLSPAQPSPTQSNAFHPHVPAPFRQLHPPKSPMYRPAVLRATEGPPLRPQSSGSTLSSDAALQDEFGNQVAGFGPGDDSAALDGNDDDDEPFYEGDDDNGVTGPPRRNHWKADSEALVCDAPTCIRQFSFYLRRHHCRRCGNVFCYEHAFHFLPLNQDARFHPNGVSSRVCDTCYKEYRRARAAARRSGSTSSSSTTSTMSTPHTTIGALPMVGGVSVGGIKAKVGSYVGSVPRDWSWSTF